MLQMWFGSAEKGVLWDPDDWFNGLGYKYLKEEFSRKVIKGVDRSEYIADKIIKSDVIGIVPSTYLSSGSKAAIMLMYSDHPVNANYIGDNVIKYIREIGLQKNITIVSGFFLEIYNSEDSESYNYPVRILNSGRIVSNISDYYDEYELAIPHKGDYSSYAVYKGN